MNIKILSLVVVSMLLTGSLCADQKHKNIHIGISQVSVLDDTNIGYSFGYGYSTSYENTLYFGGSFDFVASDANEEKVYAYGANIKLGYVVVRDFALYGIGSAMYQSVGNLNGGGFGYGGGAEYILNDSFAISAEYITHKITLEGSVDYDYDIACINFKYMF